MVLAVFDPSLSHLETVLLLLGFIGPKYQVCMLDQQIIQIVHQQALQELEVIMIFIVELASSPSKFPYQLLLFCLIIVLLFRTADNNKRWCNSKGALKQTINFLGMKLAEKFLN